MKSFNENIFKKLFSQKNLVLSTSNGTRTIHIKTVYQLAFTAALLALTSFITYETINFYYKKSKLLQVFTERSNLLIINSQLNAHVSGMNEEMKHINKYLDTLGNKPIQHLKKGLRNSINNVSSYTDANLKGYLQSVKRTDENLDESHSLMEEAVDSLNIRSNNLVGIVKKLNIPTALIKNSLRKSFSSNVVEMSNQLADMRAENNYKLEDSLQVYSHKPELYTQFAEKIGDIIDAEYTAAYLPVFSPLTDYRITSNFGTRIHPISHHISTHEGIDLRGEHKAKIYATGNGVVKFAGWAGGYGNMVDIDHGNNIVTRYGHMALLNVKKGQYVTSKTIVGYQGTTGNSTAAHVHYEVRYRNKSVNPYQFIVALK